MFGPAKDLVFILVENGAKTFPFKMFQRSGLQEKWRGKARLDKDFLFKKSDLEKLLGSFSPL